MKLKSICLLTCWYGTYPWYFPYFIHSCTFNPTVDFIIITSNIEPIPSKPSNVKIIYKAFEEIKATAFQKFGFLVSIDNPYKLCDFKPAFGFLFPEIIKGYDFWGHADIDIVYGSIRHFMTEDILNDYDVISSRHDYITGSFCLFRNIEQTNTLFMKSKDYEKVFSSSANFCFDECNYLFQELQNGGSIFDYPDNIQSMTYVVLKASEAGQLRAFFDFIIIEGATGKIKWDKGKIIYKDLYEAMFYHLIKFKTECKRPKVLDSVPDTFYFTPRKIMIKQKD